MMKAASRCAAPALAHLEQIAFFCLAILLARRLAQAPRRLSMALLGSTIAAGLLLGVLIVREVLDRYEPWQVE